MQIEASLSDQDPLDLSLTDLATKITQMEAKIQKLQESNALRSCQELSIAGETDSGLYMIDPDGSQAGNPPIEAFCNFEADPVETIIKPESNGPYVIQSCSEPGCSTNPIQYKSVKQILALIQLSQSCQQELGFGCKNTPLQAQSYGDTILGWWLDKNGDPQYFFTGDGDNDGQHVCECGLTNSCQSSPGVSVSDQPKCNCDVNADNWQEDKGNITAKDLLPITEVVYGPMPFGPVPVNGQAANFTLGPVVCKGSVEFDVNADITCKTLKIAGILKSSTQILKNGTSPRLSYCDMTKEGYGDDMETLLTYIGANFLPGGVYFVAEKTNPSGRYRVLGPVQGFNNVLINTADAFNPTTGQFIAPVPGIYRFTLSNHVQEFGLILVKVQDEIKLYINQEHGSNSNEDYNTDSHVFTLELDQGDRVHLELDSIGFNGYVWISNVNPFVFSGILTSEQS